MNLNIIDLPCDQWSQDDWREAYALYCQKEMFGKMTKKEYFDFVKSRQPKTFQKEEPLSAELAAKWSAGRRAARLWARQHGCDMNGRLLKDIPPAAETIEDLQDQVNILERGHENLKKAYVAHVTKINRNLPCMN